MKNKKDLDTYKNKCAGKIAHTTLSSAEYILSRMKLKPNEIMEIYKCKFCDNYHIGHKVGTKHNFRKIHIKKSIKPKLTEE